MSFDATQYWESEGSTGEYRPLPLEQEVPRLADAGLSGIEAASGLTRSEHMAQVRAGNLGSVHSWELVTAVDGPGTRMTTFFAGCPLRCLYCHNPDTLQMRAGTPVFAEDLLDRMLRYRSVFAATGGGVTFSGGEPLMQPQFLAKLLAGAKDAGIHTTIDTSGFLGAAATDEILANLDLVLLDIKSGDPDTYRRTTGRELAPTVAFGQRLAQAGVPVWVRFVLVPGLTDDPENIAQAAEIAAQWDNVERVEVLPFHQMARAKWETSGMRYQLAEVKPPSAAQTASARDIFRDHGLTVY
ncbi:MAG: pyruvate formate-lyase-activating protein [Trueperella sp.]|nr:pyruvate formate-lyase-activating protein [Trueperella sp.]